jgi:hypothetical protein
MSIPADDFAHTLDVRQRLAQLQTWYDQWTTEMSALDHRLDALDMDQPSEALRAAQITRWQQRLRHTLVPVPLNIAPDLIEQQGYEAIRQQLRAQFVSLSRDERLQWLTNFLFLLTPDLRRLEEKITRVRSFRSLGQQRNFLLGGVSGMGKSTFLDWYTMRHPPLVEADVNVVPIVKIDAPVSNRSPKALVQRMILECGRGYWGNGNEEDLLMRLGVYFRQCRVELLIIDEVEHIRHPDLRRRLLEVSNLTHGVPVICASCQPLRWIEGDAEVAGRWNDYFELAPYTGERLQQLLAFIELFLPFTGPSHLAQVTRMTDAGTPGEGPARLIEHWTGGVLRDIMVLIIDASTRAIEQGASQLSVELLTAAWQSIQTEPTADFLHVLRRNQPRR